MFFVKLVRQKKSIGWSKYMYVCEWDMCWRNFCNFSLVTKNVKSRSRIALFSMSAILKFDFQKRKQLRFSEVNYLKLHKKDPILHVTTAFSLKQGETRTNSVPIPHPLKHRFCLNLSESLTSTSIMKFKELILFSNIVDINFLSAHLLPGWLIRNKLNSLKSFFNFCKKLNQIKGVCFDFYWIFSIERVGTIFLTVIFF